MRIEINDTALTAQAAAAADPLIRRRAERVEDWARATAPVDTGAYRNSITLTDADEPGGYRIEADVDHAVFVEFGTRHMDGYHTLGRAADAAKG